MKKNMIRNDILTVSRGTRNSIKHLASWVNTGDRETTKRRLYIALSVPAGLIFIGTSSPVIAISLSIAAILICIFWHARTEEPEMVVHPADFAGPFQVADRVVDFHGLLLYIVRSRSGLTPAQIADIVHVEYAGPCLSEASMAATLRHFQLTPSPALAVAVGKPQEAGHSPARSEGGSQGSGKAERLKVGFTNLKKRYDAISDDKEKASEERLAVPQEQDDDRMGAEVRSGPGEGSPRDLPEGDPGSGRQPDVHGREESEGGDPDGLPSPAGWNVEVPPQAPPGNQPHQ